MASPDRDWLSHLGRHPRVAPYSGRSVTRRADMPSDAATYCVENFEPRPPQELVCTVCKGVYRDPVEGPCRHVFCSICINGWLAVGTIPGTGSCPLCRREMSASQVVPVVPLVNNMIARLTIRCPNRETGCSAKVALESLNHHLETCEFGRVLCPNCEAPMSTSAMPAHWRECVALQQPLMRCTSDCCFSLFSERQRDHNCIHEMRIYINSLEQTRDMLRHQIDHTLQCLSQLQSQIRELAARVETCAGRLRELTPAPSLPKVQHCASAFKLFPNDNPTARLFHDTDGPYCRSHFKNTTPPETSAIDAGAPGPTRVSFSTPSSALRTARKPQLTFEFGVEQSSQPPLPRSQSHSAFRVAPTLTSTSTRLSVPTVSEMLAAGAPLPATPPASSNAAALAGAHTSTATIDLATGYSLEHHLYSRVSDRWYPPSTASFSMHADDVASSHRALPPAHRPQRSSAADAVMEHGQHGGGHLSSFMRQLWESGKRYDGTNSPG
ncbi:TNF receptor-associated factor 6-like isoform X2 [Dermacentor albipictus]|uniref:TNF receptor-associated factor 6-like isoform X2 n=1 Tax=Dermacentor albipictus TaxID=60249 RepID=UPI0038FC4C4D